MVVDAPRRIKDAEEDGVEAGGADQSGEDKEVQIVGRVELVLSKDAMKDAIAIVHVKDALKEVLDWRDDCDVSSEKECSVRKYSAEAAHYEEEELDDRQ